MQVCCSRPSFFLSLLILFLLGSACPRQSIADQLLIEPDNGRTPILTAMQQAKRSIDVVMYGWTDEAFLNTVIAQKNKGKSVRIILEKRPYRADNENIKSIQAMNAQHIAWQGVIPPFQLIHQKTLIIDDRQAIIMTFNFTHSSFKNERNFAVIVDDPQVVKTISAAFSADWQHQPFHSKSPNLILSPDNSRAKLMGLIQEAKNSLDIYVQTVSDYQIVGALAKAAKRGVNVNILTSNPLREKQLRYLTKAGAAIHLTHRYYIHAKVLIIDHRKAAIGSINLTRASLDNNRELSIITSDPLVIGPLMKTFNQDWQGTQNKKIINKNKQYHLLEKISYRLIRQLFSAINHSLSHPSSNR